MHGCREKTEKWLCWPGVDNFGAVRVLSCTVHVLVGIKIQDNLSIFSVQKRFAI